MSKLLVGGIVCAFLGLVLYVVGIVTTAWLSVAYQQLGLWQLCVTYLGGTHCIAAAGISLLPAAFNATRAFAVIGLVLFFPGLIAACVSAKKNYEEGICGVLEGAIYAKSYTIAPGICGALAGAIYAGYAKSYALAPGVSVPFGFSFYLMWLQALFTIGGGSVIASTGSASSDARVDAEG
ncbi:lens fiber membrane intrinsic protein-like [Branchiostoma lanceolatum]|uniref:lens fiber membrane intrinsic protein-like n=1 Tax=Branchiostoma lanceolatum TaxID=7740 RepID=UPI003453115C